MIINWKLGLLAFVICSVTLVPALDSAYGKTVRMTHTPTFVGDFSVNSQDTSPEGMAFNTDGTKMFIVGDIMIMYTSMHVVPALMYPHVVLLILFQ